MLRNNAVTKDKLNSKGHKGFTLLEVILSFAILSIICVGVSVIAMNAISVTKDANQRTKGGMSQAAGVENYRATDGLDSSGVPNSDSVTLSINGAGTVNGVIRSGTKNGVTYYEFMK